MDGGTGPHEAAQVGIGGGAIDARRSAVCSGEQVQSAIEARVTAVP